MQPALGFAVSCSLIASIVLACLGWRLGRRGGRGWVVAAIVAVAVMLLHAFWLADNLLLAQVLPLADVIVWGNLQPLGAGLLVGVAAARMPGPMWQRVVLLVPLTLLALWRAYAPVFVSPPALAPHRMVGPVVRQSKVGTCSAAAAATALRERGIEATEAELVPLCFTTDHGTPMLGTYRGLMLKTAGTRWDVQVFRGRFSELAQLPPAPAVITIGLPGQRLTPGNRHSVALLGFAADGSAEIGDPQAGLQNWPVDQVEAVWYGHALRLVPRDGDRE